MLFEHTIMEGIQSIYTVLGSTADGIFAFFTFFGEETFLLAAIFSIYWCLDKRLGEQLLFAMYTAVGINGVAKDLVRRPRPFLTPGFEDLRYVQMDNGLVNTVHLKDSFSFPSGHSQCSGAFFGTVSLYAKKKWVTALSLACVVLVMASRLYLGVHFPTDVILGALAGLLVALLCSWAFSKFYAQRLWIFAGVVAVSLVGVFLSPSPDTVKTIGVGIGAVLGLFWESRFDFSVKGSLGRRMLRLVLGVSLLMALRVGLKLLFPAGLFFDALRYGLMGLTATGLWPWLFTRYNL